MAEVLMMAWVLLGTASIAWQVGWWLGGRNRRG
jgi:hypothetical protein